MRFLTAYRQVKSLDISFSSLVLLFRLTDLWENIILFLCFVGIFSDCMLLWWCL